jgi:GntR family transcriptional repressor for pyruvate dehydrogenase complex
MADAKPSVEESSAASLTFEPVTRSERLADKVANALAESILSGAVAIGERLPSERELCVRFDVSRPVIREAVRSLIAKGLLVDHPRRGHVVSSFGREEVTESLTFYLRGRRLDYAKLMEVRTLVEIENAGLAAERASANQIAALNDAAPRLVPNPDATTTALADVEFHRAIATATGNEFLEVLLDSIREALITVQLPTLADPKIVASARRAHERIAKQIAARDAAGAREAMRLHLEEARRGMEALKRAGSKP